MGFNAVIVGSRSFPYTHYPVTTFPKLRFLRRFPYLYPFRRHFHRSILCLFLLHLRQARFLPL